MLSAAKAANVALYREIFKQGANYGAGDESENNAVVFAALSDREDMLREVLTHKIDLAARGGLGMSTLGTATVHSSLQALERLLRAGADPDVADSSGVTPLASTLRLGRPQLATRLLAAGADPRRADPEGITVLHIAAEHEDAQMATALLDHGADPNTLDQEHRSVLFVALLNHHPQVAAVLVQRGQTNLRLPTQGYSRKHWAQLMGYDDIARSIDERLR